MKEIILRIIQEITAENIQSKHYPYYALRLEIGKRINKETENALNELIESKAVKTGNTLNDRYFELTTQHPEK